MAMSILFTAAHIGTMEIPNRMIRAASHEGLADERGRPTDEQFRFYKGFVDGGIGLIITGYAGVMQSGKSALFNMTMIDSDELIPSHSRLVDAIHQIGGKILLQVAHCGRQTWSSETGEPLLAPSAISCGFYREMPKEMTDDDISNVVESFAKASSRAKKAGYDGVEIHGAHGYLLSTFLSLHSNRRSDKWGGSLENRFRIIGKVLRAVRETVGKDYPVSIKLNTYENAPHGTSPEECVLTAKMVEDAGCCDAVELSCGTNEGGFVMARGGFPSDAIFNYMRPYCTYSHTAKLFLKTFAVPFIKKRQPPFTEGYNLAAAAMVKDAISLPVITVGGMRSKKFIEEAIATGKTDFVSLARPLICEPDLPNKFRAGISAAALCKNCNECVVASDTRHIRCYRK
ncbi:MAG: NADH:flavin oxidoreductase [Nitrospinae bacterium]|nr:NADH:flavin oxidoreductase [Nitrospinota bacterium]MBI3814990.1 NADH:flavin oxidoreductase [Nitrospinota bacterium]